MPVEPPPSQWTFPDPARAGGSEVVGVGGDLEPGTILAAYRAGIFPMPLPRQKLVWWSPQPRAVIPLDAVHASRRLLRSMRRFEVRVNTAFEQVIAACADPRRPGAWIDPEIREAYLRLHRLGWAHSVESWSPDGGELEGGLYGIAIGGLFAGESMFHRATDASKVSLLRLVEILTADDGGPEAAARRGRLLDVQWRTDHLAGLGAVEVSRRDYAALLERALELPLPSALTAAVPR